jgi:hypothetical protein
LAIALSVLLRYTNFNWPFGITKSGGDRNIFEVMTLPKGTLGSVASLLAGTLYQGNPDMNHKLWNIVSSEKYILHAADTRLA